MLKTVRRLDAVIIVKNLRFYLSDGTITDYPVDINVANAETYVLMNIPYAEFYAAEGTDAVDAVSSATKNKPRTKTLSGGSYHVSSEGNLTGGIIKNIRYYFSDGSITDYPCDIGFRVAAYNKDAAAPALIKADEQTDEQYTTYLGAIKKVTVDGTEYDNAEPVIIAPDGTIDLAAKKDGKEVFANAKRHEVKVEAAAHDDLEFMIGGFTDVQDPSHPFFKEIYWAADLGITKGFADGTFGINKPCTRGQIMTFIWRCKNKPNPKAAAKSPFKDVAKNHPYYKAILWASQNGVAKGFSDGTYGINKACTRGQMMKFFYNLEN